MLENKITTYNVYLVLFQVKYSLHLHLEPTYSQIARGMSTFFTANFWFEFILLIEKEYISDGFYSELKLLLSEKKWNISVYFISSKLSVKNICNMIVNLFRNQLKIVVLHVNPHLATRIFQCSNCINSNISWCLTDKVFTRNKPLLKYYPDGALAFTITEQTYLQDILRDSISVILEAIMDIDTNVRSFAFADRDCSKLTRSEKDAGNFFYG